VRSKIQRRLGCPCERFGWERSERDVFHLDNVRQVIGTIPWPCFASEFLFVCSPTYDEHAQCAEVDRGVVLSHGRCACAVL
jgi:hypothetical protein